MEKEKTNKLLFNLNSLGDALEESPEALPPLSGQAKISLESITNKINEIKILMLKEQQEFETKYAKIFMEVYRERSETIKKFKKDFENFWLTVLLNHPSFAQVITSEDEKALKYINNIELTYFKEGFGYYIDFSFDSNPFFSNTVLRKSYFLTPDNSQGVYELLFEKSEGTQIEWLNNLCFKTEIKTQRHKKTGELRTVTNNLKLESFFHFFDPPQIPINLEDDDNNNTDPGELEFELQDDFEKGEILKEKLIPNALYWFIGAACEYEYENDYDDDETD